MRKAQIIGQVFIWIMAIVISGMVLMFGIKFVGQQLENQDKIMYTRFVNGISNVVDGTRIRSVDQVEYRVPSDYRVVCFVDYEVDPTIFLSADSDEDNFIRDNYPSVLDEVGIRPSGQLVSLELKEQSTNMFLIDENGAVSAESVGKIKLEHPYRFCTEIVSSYVELQFEGVKGGVKVSGWDE